MDITIQSLRLYWKAVDSVVEALQNLQATQSYFLQANKEVSSEEVRPKLKGLPSVSSGEVADKDTSCAKA